jgi:hypothetical protein
MTASTVAQYLAALPADRRAALSAVRKVINENLPDGYEEGMQFGMIGWYVPLSMYPAGYGENPKVPLSFVALASQKSGMVLHFLCFLRSSHSLNLVHQRIQEERQEARHG